MRMVSLIGTPSFLRGMARVLDLGGTLNRCDSPVSDTPTDDDVQALLGDWEAVAGDMGVAFRATANQVARARRHAEAQA
ncbi:MAG TPA: hypothetical protein VFJ16_01470 [Longimicrobium sp.]|nr:hypothetical protein [Longimicrobium sp.]